MALAQPTRLTRGPQPRRDVAEETLDAAEAPSDILSMDAEANSDADSHVIGAGSGQSSYGGRSEHSYNIAGPAQSPAPTYRIRLADGTEMTGLNLASIEGMLQARTAGVDDAVAYGGGPYLPVRSHASLKAVVEQVSVPRAEPTLSGPLSQWVLVRLVYKMAADKVTGCLELHRGDAVKSIYFRRGRTQYIASNQHQELLGPFMVANGYISQADIDMAVARARATGTKLGDLLIGMNLVKPFQLYQVLERQLRAKFIDAFGWDSGSYAFYDAESPPTHIVPLDFDPIGVLAEGVRDRVSLATLEPMFQDKLDRPLFQSRKTLITLTDLKLQARESKAVSLLFSSATPRQAYEECYNNRQQRLALLHVMFLLLQTELVTFDPERA